MPGTQGQGETLLRLRGQTVAIVDRHAGEVRDAQLFVRVIGSSNLIYSEATWRQWLADWTGSRVELLGTSAPFLIA